MNQSIKIFWRCLSSKRHPQLDKMKKRPLYFDSQATTPMDPRVLDAMMPFMTTLYGNAHSRTHAFGWEAEDAVEEARCHVAKLIRAEPKEIVFTSGATESNNLAIKGAARFYALASGRSSSSHRIFTSQIEHKCVLESCRAMENEETCEVKYLPVLPRVGIINQKALKAELDAFSSHIAENTPINHLCLLSVMLVNNEIGVIQPFKDLVSSCRMFSDAYKNKKIRVVTHTDAAQAVGKISIDVNDLDVDLMSISGHKLYGPKGIGALYVRRRPRRIRLEPLLSGGGQERGIRSGTLPVPLVVGLGKACEISLEEMEYDKVKVNELTDRLINGLSSQLSHLVINGSREHCVPGCVNISFSCVEGESLMMALKDICLSSGSACTSASLEPSYVLRALGSDEDLAHSSIRFGINRFSSSEEVDYLVESVIRQVRRLRELSPLWEMIQEGIDLKTIQWTQH